MRITATTAAARTTKTARMSTRRSDFLSCIAGGSLEHHAEPAARAGQGAMIRTMNPPSESEAAGPSSLPALAAAVLRVPRDPERVLEIGCGEGDGVLFLAREFPRAR